jgi:hypothetical protein
MTIDILHPSVNGMNVTLKGSNLNSQVFHTRLFRAGFYQPRMGLNVFETFDIQPLHGSKLSIVLL